MTGETQHVYAISDADSGAKEQGKDFAFEKDRGAFGGAVPERVELCARGSSGGGTDGACPLPGAKDKEPHGQREAVIRPQQAGRIDFKSLQSKPKFAGDSAWSGGPRSPPGKSRARERSRRRGEPRGHPTIGIAYPQQKVAPPKEPKEPPCGAYRFHAPEREAEPPPEELGPSRRFAEAAASLTSPSYTSEAAAGARLGHGAKGQLHYLEFQANGAGPWPSPEKGFAGASYGAQKPSPFGEGAKGGLGALPFQLPFQLLHEAAKEPFGGAGQDYGDVAAHAAFGFPARDWHDEALSGGSYALSPPAAAFLPPPPPAGHHAAAYKGRSERPADLNGALPSTGATDPKPSTFQESQAVFPSSLHSPSVPKAGGKRQASSQDGGPRLLLASSPLRRNMPPNSLSQVHFQSKVYCGSAAGGAGAGPVPFDASVPRLAHAWDGAAKAFSPADPNAAPYPNPVGNQFSFECQPGPEQRQHRQKGARGPWQQIHLAPAMPAPNRIELSRQLAPQKLPFPLGTSEWPGKAQKGSPLSGSPGYRSKKLLGTEGLGAQRGEPGRQSCGSASAFPFEGGKEPGSPACDSRGKTLFYSMGQAGPPPAAPSRNAAGSALALVAASPCESPLPSPLPNATCGSTCSSLSPMSSSPLNPGFEDSHVAGALAPSPFFHHPCHPKESGKTFHAADVLSSGALHYHPSDSVKSFHFPPDALKDDNRLLKCAPESPFHKPSMEVAKGCLDGLNGEPPPPPYSSHHLLATSLSSASLDQLDVLLTCRQCDQNYSNLSSFLEHRQFCGSHAAFPGDPKEAPRAAEGRKTLPPDAAKHPHAGANLGLSPDPQAHLMALNKSDDFLLEGESKSDGKEDALKSNLFNGLNATSLPLTASDLEIDDAKLDSLITEALNGLEYQSDNPEIDSSFIDVFADEELTAVKAAGNGLPHKTKEAPESKSKHPGAEEKAASQPKISCHCEESRPRGEQARRRAGKQHVHKGRAGRRLPGHEGERQHEPHAPEPPRSKSPDRGEEGAEKTARLRVGRRNSSGCAPASGQKQPRKVNQELHTKSDVGPSGAKSSKLPRFSMKDVKKRKARSGTWSKELIHKIVQQKNKFHKLHAKGGKHAQFSTGTERLAPAAKEGKFQEYDYISDSDDDGTDCTKLHGRKRRGAGFIGRSKYSFSKKRPGRSERAKEKDPAQSYSQKRESRKRETQEHRRVPSKEVSKKEDCASRVRRRSSQSSTGSNRSTSAASETGPSPGCTERADSDGEKGGVLERTSPDSAEHAPRTPLGIPEGGSPQESQESQEEVSRGAKRFGSAKFLLAGCRTHPSAKPEVPLVDFGKEEPQAQEKQLPSTDTFGRSPARSSCEDHAEEPKGAANHMGETGKALLESPELALVNPRHPFAPYAADALKFPAEELMAPSHGSREASPGNASAAYPGADGKYLKERGLCAARKDYPVPVAPYGGDAVGMLLAGKVADAYVGSDDAFFNHKGLPGHYEPNLFSKPPALGSSHTGDMYLCRDDISSSSFGQKHANISPYAAENAQPKVSSPLSFDSSSIFGELPVTEFDPPLYESVSASKDGYVAAFACPANAPGKSLPFEPPYPPFLQEKEWTLMEEVAPMLPEDVTPFHNLSTDKPLAKKFPDEGAVPPNQLALPLSDRIADYNVTSFMNNISDDELEIKRLVTELESQLQTGKLNHEAAALQKAEQHLAARLQERAAEQFPPLNVDGEPSRDKGLFLADDLGRTDLLATKTCAGERLGSEKPGVGNAHSDYESPREPWSCSVEFGSLGAGMCAPGSEDPLSVEHFCPKDASDRFQVAETAKGSDSRKKEKEAPLQGLPDSRADKIEAPIYTDHVIKSPLVVTDPLFPKTLEAAEANKEDILPSLPCKRGAENFPVAGKTPKDFDAPAELEKFDTHLPTLKPEFGFEQGPAPALELAFPPCIKDAEEGPLSKCESPRTGKNAVSFGGDSDGPVSLGETEENKSPAAFPAPATGDKAAKHKVLLLDMLSLPKEGSRELPGASQENPLQQLQLFVARTVKSNEEELLLPCFPALLAAGAQPERREDSGGNAEGESGTCCPARGDGDVPAEPEGIATPSKEAAVFPGACEQLESLGEMDSYGAKRSPLVNLELQNNVTELQRLGDEHAERGDINIHADGASRERDDLLPLRNAAVTPLPGQGRKADALVGERERDKNTATLAFKTHEQSLLSHSSLEKEAPEKARLETSEAECRSWHEGSSQEAQVLGSIKTIRCGNHQAGHGTQPLCGVPRSPASPLNPSDDSHRDHPLLQGAKACPANGKDPEDRNGKSLGGCRYTSEFPGFSTRLVGDKKSRAETGFVLEVEGAQKRLAKGCPRPRVPPFNPKDVGREVPASPRALSGHRFQETQAHAVADTITDSQPAPPEVQGYPALPTPDLLLIGEGEEKLNEKTLGNCSRDGSSPQNGPGGLPRGSDAQQVPPAASSSTAGVAELGPPRLNSHLAAEVTSGDPSKTMESGGKNLKSEKPKTCGAERGGEAGGCMLNNVGQGEDSIFTGLPNTAQNELLKGQKPPGPQVTCDICSASFRSKPGLTRHKAVKHQIKNSSISQASKTPESDLIPVDKASKVAKKVPRRTLKTSAKEKRCSSPVPDPTVEYVPKKIDPGLEKEPSAQMQEVVSRVLSDLSVLSFEMSQELRCTGVLNREMKAKYQRSETRGAGEAEAEKPHPGKQSRKGEKGRRNQSKDPAGANSHPDKKLNRKVRRRKAKGFPNRNEPSGPSGLENNVNLGPADLSGVSPSLSPAMEGLREPGSCISTEEQKQPNSFQPSQKVRPSPRAGEDLGNRMESSRELVRKESMKGTAACPEEVEDPGGVGNTEVCKKWVVKQVEKGLGKVGTERHLRGEGADEGTTGTEDTRAGTGRAGSRSSAPPSPTAPAGEQLLLEKRDLAMNGPAQGTLQDTCASSPCGEPKRWARGDLQQDKEPHVDLPSLFDDDSMFSQLFPRDEQLIRRKCTRVYGKRAKKPKAVPEATPRPAGAGDLFAIRLASDLSESSSFCVPREDPGGYETISLDDALILNMCHGSKAKGGEAVPGGSKNTALGSDCGKINPEKEVIDLEDNNMLSFLCQNSQVENIPSLNLWGCLEKEGESVCTEEVFEAPMELESEHSLGEMSSEAPELAEEPLDGKGSDDESDSPEFHTIDIEMLNAKLQMRDMCFFGPCEDLPGHPDENAVGFKQKQSKHSRHRLEDGKVGKTRGDGSIKSKDKQYKCKVCFQWFLTLGELDFHKLSHNPSPPPTCYMCVQRKFSSREQLRDHLKEKHARNKAGLWACGMCLKEISDVWMYNEHLREHATQFARKGQAQKSVLGLPACFGEDSAAVTRFLNTIMYRRAGKSSRHPAGRANKSPKELPPEQEAMKDPLESNVKVKPSPSSSSKARASPSPERMGRSESSPKSVPMHPDCKDPSRDCHHCGKQFPKPFKLQRHLVVHSLQKIYLCHKCPMFYQETKELRSHLSQEHGIVEEQEIKHTTLYACELCADVMHVIKKSFICSMCNYTFSKKEQYDRHMEKHLAGSNKTFKFRGVLRPGIASREGREKVREEGSLPEPPNKKRKVVHHSSSPVDLDHATDLHVAQVASPSMQDPGESFPPGAPQPQSSQKAEDLVGDFSDLLAEMEKSQFDALPATCCLSPSPLPAATSSALSTEELEKGAFHGKPLPFLESPKFNIDLAGLADGKLSPPRLTEKRGNAHKKGNVGNKDEYVMGILENPDATSSAGNDVPFLQLAKKVPSPRAEAPQAKEPSKALWSNPSANDGPSWEGASKATSSEAAHHPAKDKAMSPVLNKATKESVGQRKAAGSQAGSDASPSAEESPKCSTPKDKAVPEAGACAKESSGKEQGAKSGGHHLKGEATSNTGRHADKAAPGVLGKQHPKKRKEHKSSSHRGGSGSRENLAGDGKKKKMRTPGPGRSESAGDFKHADWSNAEASALSPGRREAHCNRLIPKGKPVGMGNQLKKPVLDAYNQKKGEMRHANGERKKAILGKSLQQVLAKGPAPRCSVQRARAARGAKPAEPAAFRTAESQNHLLSQLFGQKLTSFKIPLRRDTSE